MKVIEISKMGMDLIICELEHDHEKEIFNHRIGLRLKILDIDDGKMILKDVD